MPCIPTDIELSYRLLLSLHSIIAVSVYPSLINFWYEFFLTLQFVAVSAFKLHTQEWWNIFKARILLWLNFIRWNRYENLLEWCLLCKIPWKLKFAYIFMQILWFDTIIYFTLGSQHSVVCHFHSSWFSFRKFSVHFFI